MDSLEIISHGEYVRSTDFGAKPCSVPIQLSFAGGHTADEDDLDFADMDEMELEYCGPLGQAQELEITVINKEDSATTL